MINETRQKIILLLFLLLITLDHWDSTSKAGVTDMSEVAKGHLGKVLDKHTPYSTPKRRRRKNKNTQIEYCWEHVHHSYLYHRGHLRDKRVHIKRKDHETQQSAQKAKTRWSSLLFLLYCWGMPSQICCCNFNFDRLTFVVRSTASKRSCHRGHWADKRGLII